MSCFNESFVVNKVGTLAEMRVPERQLDKTLGSVSCGSCAMLYADYKQLLEHLYWRHGTESFWCTACGLKQWRYAPHVCHVLPINDADIAEESDANILYCDYGERESDYCFCGKYVEESPMIACDDPRCSLQWYHFKCVGVESPPDGDWLCPQCIKNNENNLTQKQAVEVNT